MSRRNGSMRCWTRLALHGLAALIAIAGFAAVAPQTSFAAATCLTGEESALLDRINTYRQVQGKAPLVASPALTAAARHHAESMATHNYFPADYSVRYEGPGGDETITWQENIANAGYPDNTSTIRSAIIGAGSSSAAAIVRGLSERSSYEAVLTEARFQAIGIGIASNPDSDEGVYWAITFGSVRDGSVEACPGVPVPVAIASGGRTANSAESGLAYDGDLKTAWVTESDTPPSSAHIWFDLGSPQQIRAIEWMFSRGGAADQFLIEVSGDQETWTEIAAKSNGSVGDWRSVRWSGETRYVRFTFLNPNGDPVLGYLAEVRILA
jgi:uncharacterized protein YkwD